MDRYLLEYEIKRNGLTISEFCQKVGISTASYYRKINGRSDFTQSEISKTMEVLDLTSPVPIFLLNKCLKKTRKGESMETPIDERFLSTAEASKVLGIDEQALRTLGREGAKGVYRIGKQFRFRIKDFCTAEVELADRLDTLSQEVSELETTYREMVERFGLKDKGTQNAQAEYYSMLRALEIMKGEI